MPQAARVADWPLHAKPREALDAQPRDVAVVGTPGIRVNGGTVRPVVGLASRQVARRWHRRVRRRCRRRGRRRRLRRLLQGSGAAVALVAVQALGLRARVHVAPDGAVACDGVGALTAMVQAAVPAVRVLARPRVAPRRTERGHEAAVPRQAAKQRRAAAAKHALQCLSGSPSERGAHAAAGGRACYWRSAGWHLRADTVREGVRAYELNRGQGRCLLSTF